MPRQSWKSERHVSASIPGGCLMGWWWAPGAVLPVVHGGPGRPICGLLTQGEPSLWRSGPGGNKEAEEGGGGSASS
eukprot:3389352-Heterocapsa_arctica.AAC.1